MITVVDQPPATRRTWKRWILGFVLAGIAVMWIYVFWFDLSGRGQPLDRVSDRQWSAAAEAVCAPVRAKVFELPQASSTRTPQERAVVFAQATELLATMVTRLQALPFNGKAAEREVVDRWLADWRTLLQDRQEYIAQLRTGYDGEFGVTAGEGGAPIDGRMDTFADVNHMKSCEYTGD
jgi:hypothetical protein